MGPLFTPKLSWHDPHLKLTSQAQRSLFAIRAYQNPFGYFFESFKIFDSMVKPILCYASLVWGFEYVDIIESTHTKFCRNLLHVRKSSNTCMVLGECGRLRLCVTYYTNCIKYWCITINAFI